MDTIVEGIGQVSLIPAAHSDEPVLANLLQLYVHDMSETFPNVTLGDDGRFQYSHLSKYWSSPKRRFPFLIRAGGRLAGFALARRGSPVSDDPSTLDVAEFFVVRSQRRMGVGKIAARLLWEALPGRWTVRVSEGNVGALAFWDRAIHDANASTPVISALPGDPHAWRIFTFETKANAPAGSV